MLRKEEVYYLCFNDKIFIGFFRQERDDLEVEEHIVNKIYNRTMEFKK